MNTMLSDAMRTFDEMTKKETIVEVGTRKFMLKGYEPIKDPVVSGLASYNFV